MLATLPTTLVGMSVACYALALAAKSIVMTLPLVLVVLDAWPLGRLGRQWRDWIVPASRGIWKEKLPYAVVASAAAGVALVAVWSGGYLTSVASYRFPARVALAGYSLAFYVWKTLLPSGLSPLYELP